MNKKLVILFILIISVVTIISIYINFDLSMKYNINYTYVTSIYLISWVIFIVIGIKFKADVLLCISFIFWLLTLITSIIMIIGNIMGVSNNFLDILALLLIPIFATPLKGIAFFNNSLINASMFSTVSILFIVISYIFKNRNINI